MPKYPCDCEAEEPVEIACLICSETFDRANNSDITVDEECSANVVSGTPSIESNQLKIDDASTIIIWEDHPDPYNSAGGHRNFGFFSYTQKLIYDFQLATGNVIKFITHYIDSNNYYYVLWDQSNDQIDFRKVDGGVDSQLEINTTDPEVDWSYELANRTVAFDFDTADLPVGKNYIVVIYAGMPDTNSGYYYIKMEIYNMTDENSIYLDSRYDSSPIIGTDIFTDPQVDDYTGYFGIGTSSSHSGNLLVNDVVQQHYLRVQQDFADPTPPGPVYFCPVPSCWYCFSDGGDIFSASDIRPDFGDTGKIWQSRERPCTINVISGTLEYTGQYVRLRSGVEIEIDEEDLQLDKRFSFSIVLDMDLFSSEPWDLGVDIDLIFDYQDANNYNYLKFIADRPPTDYPQQYYCELRTVIAGTDTLQRETIYELTEVQLGSFFYGFTIEKREGVDCLFINSERTNSFGIEILSFESLTSNALAATLIPNVGDIADWYRGDAGLIATLPGGGSKFGTFRLKVNSYPSNRELLLKSISLKRSSLQCITSQPLLYCNENNLPDGYELVISGITDQGVSNCDDSQINGTYLFERYDNFLQVSEPGEYSGWTGFHWYGIIPYCRNTIILDPEDSRFRLTVIMEDISPTQYKLKFRLDHYDRNLFNLYSKEMTYNIASPINCFSESITLDRNTSVVIPTQSPYRGWPDTITLNAV